MWKAILSDQPTATVTDALEVLRIALGMDGQPPADPTASLKFQRTGPPFLKLAG
jgi:hypothetical protein